VQEEEEEEEEETGLESNTLDEASVTLPSDDGDDQFETVQQVNVLFQLFFTFMHRLTHRNMIYLMLLYDSFRRFLTELMLLGTNDNTFCMRSSNSAGGPGGVN
jgi:hypothetical protein